MSEHILKKHNKNLLLYHIVCPAKYRRVVFTSAVEETLKTTCIGISERYEIHFVEIGADEDHVHFLVQSVPTIAPSSIVKIIKGTTAREIYKNNPEVKKKLWGGNIWTAGYYINTVGAYANEEVIRAYVEKQGKEYKKIYDAQLSFLDDLI
ncbi:MAG: IS200/IS605 family transposase [Candidatus Latescibacterota bacterium]